MIWVDYVWHRAKTVSVSSQRSCSDLFLRICHSRDPSSTQASSKRQYDCSAEICYWSWTCSLFFKWESGCQLSSFMRYFRHGGSSHLSGEMVQSMTVSLPVSMITNGSLILCMRLLTSTWLAALFRWISDLIAICFLSNSNWKKSMIEPLHAFHLLPKPVASVVPVCVWHSRSCFVFPVQVPGTPVSYCKAGRTIWFPFFLWILCSLLWKHWVHRRPVDARSSGRTTNSRAWTLTEQRFRSSNRNTLAPVHRPLHCRWWLVFGSNLVYFCVSRNEHKNFKYRFSALLFRIL